MAGYTFQISNFYICISQFAQISDFFECIWIGLFSTNQLTEKQNILNQWQLLYTVLPTFVSKSSFSIYCIFIHILFISSFPLSLSPLYLLSSSSVVYAFPNVLMKCVVAMVSNVSDSSDAWPGMLLHAHMYQHSIMPHRAGHTHMHTNTCIYTNRGRACIFACLYAKNMWARVHSGVCQDKTAAASCMRRETSCCLSTKCGRSAKISTNQLCGGWIQEVSLTQKHYEPTR